jgi:hypothetical protein
MEPYIEATDPAAAGELPPGIVIHDTFGPQPRPAISAFIWGGKTRPVPSLPYGRRGG